MRDPVDRSEPNEAIKQMLSTPGLYECFLSWDRKFYFVVEVEADGTCHQLTPQGKRDGVLGRDRWAPDVCVRKHVPGKNFLTIPI